MSGGMESMAEDERVNRQAHEALYFLPRGLARHALEVALDERDRYAKALQGIASCATKCGCCEMHVRVARMALSNEHAEHVINDLP